MTSHKILENSQGGVDDRSPEAMARAAKADLITFPKSIRIGLNCGNCIYSSNNYCTHPEVRQAVNSRMCCNHWDEPGTLRSWE